MKKEQWQGMHSAYLGRVDKETASFIWAWIQAKNVNFEVLKDVYEKLGAIKADTNKNITFVQIKVLYNQMTGRTRVDSGRVVERCQRCKGTGFGHVVLGGRPGERLKPIPKDRPEKYTIASVSCIPCLCSIGNKMNRAVEYSSRILQRLWESCGFDMGYDAERFAEECREKQETFSFNPVE